MDGRARRSIWRRSCRMGGIGDTSTKQNSKSPGLYYESAALGALDKMAKIAEMGYIPYQGMDVAGLSEPILGAMAQGDMWSNTFMNPGGLPLDYNTALANVNARQPASYIDPVTGIRGTSSYAGYQQELAKLGEKYPMVKKYLDSMFMDPQTGKLSQFWNTQMLTNKQLKKTKKGKKGGVGGTLGGGSTIGGGWSWNPTGTGTGTGTGGPGGWGSNLPPNNTGGIIANLGKWKYKGNV